MVSLLSQLNWPNLAAGFALSAAAGFISWITRKLYEHYVLSKDLPYPVWGKWYSVEFDPKGNIEYEKRNTFLKLKVSRGILNRVNIQTLGPIEGDWDKAPTGWKVKGDILNGDTFVGEWETTIENSKRFGSVVLKFIDYGRAVGYYIGPAGKDHPVYGYWVMSRDKSDIKKVASKIIEDEEFEMFDVSSFVINLPHPKEM